MYAGKVPITMTLVLVLAAAAWAQTRDETTSPLDERQAAVRLMRHVDRDGDRRMDPNELSSAQELAYLLLDLDCEQADADGDGEVSLDELEQAVSGLYSEIYSTGDAQADEQAATVLNRVFSWPALLEQLSQEEQYAAELAALRAELESLDDVDIVTTHVLRYPARYPRLLPLIKHYRRYYLPARARLHRHYRWRHRAAHRPHRVHVKPHGPKHVHPKAKPVPGKVHPTTGGHPVGAKPGKAPVPAGARPRGGGRRR